MGDAPLYRNWESCVEENQRLRQELHDRDHTIEHLVQANHALHDELAAARARIAALENQLDELGEGAYRAAAELARMRPVVEAARMALDDLLSDANYGLNHRTEGALMRALASLDATREEAHGDA